MRIRNKRKFNLIHIKKEDSAMKLAEHCTTTAAATG